MLIKSWLDARQKAKIAIMSGRASWEKVLKDEDDGISDDELLQMYGGRWTILILLDCQTRRSMPVAEGSVKIFKGNILLPLRALGAIWATTQQTKSEGMRRYMHKLNITTKFMFIVYCVKYCF